ncbi:MAG: MFS transporter [bacterium]
MKPLRKAQVGWISYDFANTIFSMNIVTFFFAPWIVLDLGVEDIYYSLAYSGSMIFVALSMPTLGRRADRVVGKLPRLRTFTLLCIFFTVLLSLGALTISNITVVAIFTLICFAVANYFYEGGLTFYNALLADVSDESNVGRVSGIGVAFGYLGAIAGLLLVLPITDGSLIPGVVGRQYAFMPTALLFLLFALPTSYWVRERPVVSDKPLVPETFLASWKEALRESRHYPGVLRFLIADYLIEDAIATLIVFMAIYAEAVAGFADADKVVLFVASTLCAFGGSLVFGWLSDKLGSKLSLLIAVFGWTIVLSSAVILTSRTAFFVLGGFVGVFLGAVWTTSRPLLNSLVPREKLGQFYGLYTLSGRAAATIGPLLWGFIVLFAKADKPLGRWALDILGVLGVERLDLYAGTIHYRLAIASLLVVMLLGLSLLFKVPNRRRYSP